jgi:hypothetical protein
MLAPSRAQCLGHDHIRMRMRGLYSSMLANENNWGQAKTRQTQCICKCVHDHQAKYVKVRNRKHRHVGQQLEKTTQRPHKRTVLNNVQFQDVRNREMT